jgi:nicotinate-nucleotide pyrophosphorylase (carboxylating)
MSENADITLVRRALAEDLAGYGDITSELTVPEDLQGRAVITARTDLVVCGLHLARIAMQEVDHRAIFTTLAEEGSEVGERDWLAAIEGPARSILTAERTMLNLISHLSGVATQSRRFARAVAGTGATVVDTRKTVPGLRVWEKQAVALGGCRNHRFGLFDMVLVKNNHLAAAGGVKAAMDRVKAAEPRYLKVEVEVESEADLREAIACGADIIMLDNQDLASMKHLVGVARGIRPGVVLEASGGVSLDNVRAIAETGVDIISTSALTMGAPPVDVGLTLRMGPQADGTAGGRTTSGTD